MKILALEKEMSGLGPDDFKPHLKAEAEKVWELYQAGIMRELYFDRNSHNAVIMLECKDAAEAGEYLDSLPLVRNKLISFDIVELEPYSGFSRLFDR